ncbi:TonB-dependent receptor domain-containing protein [Sphingomonas oryzagri]
MGCRRVTQLAAGFLAATIFSVPGYAQQIPARHQFDVPAQPLKYALRDVTQASGLQLFAASRDLAGRTSPELHGNMTVRDALDQLLTGTGLEAQIDGGSIFIRGRSDGTPASTGSASPERSEIVVTGTHLKGAPIASPTITLSAQTMRDAGQASLTKALEDLPQNFGGGQNPNIGLGVSGSQNASGAATINLRGVGGDATLTLLNGHRLAYDVSGQSIDISSIPFLAVDRIEIVPDGASALYGSDAVAGVANILLRRDYSGVMTDVRVAGATDGGAFDQQYGLVAGTRWDGGGVMAAYEFDRQTAVSADDRSYARDRAPGLTLTPYLRHHNGALSVHQDILDNLTFALDIIANQRWNSYDYALDSRGDYKLNGGRVSSTTSSFAVSPSISWAIGNGWSASIAGMYGLDHNKYVDSSYYNGTSSISSQLCNCNSANSVEANITGPIASLPAGPVNIAVGGGYRSNNFTQSSLNLDVSQHAYFAYAEAEMPIFSPDQSRWYAHRLLLTGALRYENYPSVAHVFTPKLGLVYEPVDDLTVKMSWGRSFKAPTLYQQFSAIRSGLLPATVAGGSPGSTVVELVGGNRSLKPERARSWSVTAQWHPSSVPGFDIEVSYFDIDYKDRVVSPIQYVSLALQNPQYSQYVQNSPNDAEISEALSDTDFTNYTGAAFNRSNVAAIIDDRYVNAGRQLIHGIDADVKYSFSTAKTHWTLSGSATYLVSHQRLTAEQPLLALAGTLYNPPHFRARAGTVWTHAAFTISAFINYTGGVRDNRTVPAVGVRSMTTFDINGRYAPGRLFGSVSGVELGLSVENLFNRAPGIIRNTPAYQQPYDSTNYSPVGRLVALDIRKKW